MDWRPCSDDEFVIDADTFDFTSNRSASCVEGKGLDSWLRFGRRILNGAQQPLVALTRGAGYYFIGALKFLLGLLLLEKVDVEPALLYILDNSLPC